MQHSFNRAQIKCRVHTDYWWNIFRIKDDGIAQHKKLSPYLTQPQQSQRRGWGHHHRRYFQQSHMNQNSFHEIPPMQPKEIRHSSTPNHGNYCLVQRNSSEQKVFQRFSKAVPSESSTLFMTSQSSARNRDNEKSPVTRPQQQHNLNTNSQTQGTRPPSTDKVLIANRQAIRDIDNKNDGQCDLEEGRNFGIKHSYHHQLQVTPPPQGNSKKSEQSGTKGSWGKHGFLSASKNSSTPQKYRTTTQKKQWGTPTVTLSATIDPGSFSTSKGSLSTEQKASQPPPTFSHSTPYQLVKKKERKEHCGSAKLHMMEHDLKSQCDGQHEKETAGDDGCKKKRLKRKKSTKVTFAENGEILGRYHDSSDNLPNTGANFSPKLPSRSSLWGMTIPRKAAYQPSVQIDTKDLCNASKTLKLPSKLRLDEAENNGANPSKIPKRKNIVKGGKETPTKARCGEEERSDSKTGEKRKTATKVAPEPSQIHQLKRKRGGGGECELHCHPLNLVVEDMLRIITATRRAKQGRKTGHCNDANKGVPKESVHTHDDWDRPEIRNQARLQLMRRYVAAARTGMDPNEFTRRLLKYVLASDEETATDSTKTKQMRLKSYTHMPIEQQNQNL